MDNTFLYIWNYWSVLFLVLFSLNMVAVGHLCSRKGRHEWQPPLMILAGALLALIFSFSGLLATIVSIPAGLILTMLISKAVFPDWKKGQVDPPYPFPKASIKGLQSNSDEDQGINAA